MLRLSWTILCHDYAKHSKLAGNVFWKKKTINNKFTESMNWQPSRWLNTNSTQSVCVYLYEMGHKSVNTLQEHLRLNIYVLPEI